MLKAEKILTSTAVLWRRLVQDEGENWHPLFLMCRPKTTQSSPLCSFPNSGRVTVPAEHCRCLSEMYQIYIKLIPETKPELFWKLKLVFFFFPPMGPKRQLASYEYFSIWSPWETMDGTARSKSFGSCVYSQKHKQIELISSKGQAG